MRIKTLIIILMTLVATSCNRKQVLHFYPEDKSQCITIITEDGIRYIINGYFKELPDNEYVKINVENIDPLGDSFWVCWKVNSNWEAVVNGSTIIESKLDTMKYSFKTSLPKDERDITNELKFRQQGCSIFSFDLMRLSPNNGGIVEID